MLDLKLLRADVERVREGMRRKGEADVDLDELLRLDARWREQLQELEALRAERNRVSQEIGRRKQEGEDAAEAVADMRRVRARIDELEDEVGRLQQAIDRQLLRIPNPPHPDVPAGQDESENVEVRRWGEPPAFRFRPQAHWDLGPALGAVDFERASRMTGARFAVYTGPGARLVRALMQFMLDLHTTEHGYREVWPPLLVSRASMTGTGQLPKFEDDVFCVEKEDLFLVPTAEVPLTNLHREEILDGEQLPLRYAAYTPCFRAEAGAAGRDTRGLIRQHQFDKVELVKVVRPESSYEELESLVREAGEVLRRLELPYRVALMCGGDTGFAAAKKYDLEVWMPSYDRYVEISSCTNFEDFQARRAGIRFRPDPRARPAHPHTLNGSGLAIGRTVAALLENFQQEDGSVRIPAPLHPYFGARSIEPPETVQLPTHP